MLCNNVIRVLRCDMLQVSCRKYVEKDIEKSISAVLVVVGKEQLLSIMIYLRSITFDASNKDTTTSTIAAAWGYPRLVVLSSKRNLLLLLLL